MKEKNEHWLEQLAENYKLPEDEKSDTKKMLTEEQLNIIKNSKK